MTTSTGTETKRRTRRKKLETLEVLGVRVRPATKKQAAEVALNHFDGSQRKMIEAALERLFSELSVSHAVQSS